MYILAIDQGTTGTRAILFDSQGQIVDSSYREIRQIYPRPGWVEHDPLDIWESVVETVSRLARRYVDKIAAVGITNQRETTVVWNKKSGRPVANAIVWQCRRTAPICEAMKPQEQLFRERTGLPLDAYFSGTKLKWILDHHVDLPKDELLFGTVDSWLIWKLTQGHQHLTDFTNASRTLLYNIREHRWDADLCELLHVPLRMLPEVRNSADDFGSVKAIPELKGIPIAGVAGDQQAALFGQACFERGTVKNTYGTGCFAMLNIGAEFLPSSQGLLTTLAINSRGQACYAYEGSVFIAGAALQWLRDELGLIRKAGESEQMSRSIEDNEGVYLVPAFVGLGAPHWRMDARGTLVGLSRGSNRNHIVRAALEAMAYQSRDVLVSMEAEAGLEIESLAVDGGAARNDFLMQFQADILDKPVIRPSIIESTALGAAYLAGLQTGIWENTAQLCELKRVDREFRPAVDPDRRHKWLEGWQHALRQTLTR